MRIQNSSLMMVYLVSSMKQAKEIVSFVKGVIKDISYLLATRENDQLTILVCLEYTQSLQSNKLHFLNDKVQIIIPQITKLTK